MSNPVLDYFDRSIATFDGDPASNDYQRGCLDTLKTAKAELATVPIPMLLFCPRCGTQHIDAPDQARGWDNPPHRSHLCHQCGTIWRPADVLTEGVATIQSFGSADTWYAGHGIMPADVPLCIEDAGHDVYNHGYDDGFVDAHVRETGQWPEDDGAALLRGVDGTSRADGWQNHRDGFLVAVSSPAQSTTLDRTP